MANDEQGWEVTMEVTKKPWEIPSLKALGAATADLKGPFGEPIFLDDGYAIPRTFTISVDATNQPLHVEVDVEIEDKRARSRRVSVSTDRKGGVSSTTLRSVPIRGIVAQGCLKILSRAGVTDTGTITFTLMPENLVPADVEPVKRLVGYVEEEEEE